MGNTSSHQSISSPPSTSSTFPLSSKSSSKCSTKSSSESAKHFHLPSNPFSRFHSHSRRTSSIDEHGALLKDVQEDDDDGTYLLRRGSFESREEWLARKQIIAARIKGDGKSDVGIGVWNGYSIHGGKGQL